MVKMNCRLMYVVGQLGPGGLERQLYLLLQAMDRERYGPQVVVWNFRETDTYVEPIKKLGVPIHNLPAGLNRTAKLLAFRKLVRSIQPDVLHSYCFFTNFAAWWATVGTGIIPVGSVRSDLTNDQQACGPMVGRLSARWPRTQIYNNFSSADTVRQSSGFFVPSKVLVVRNGLDLSKFHAAPISTNGVTRIVGVGSLLEIKRWDRLLDATRDLAKRGYHFHVEIAGVGPLHASLEHRIRQLGIEERIRLIGYSNDIVGLLARSAFLVHPSDVEGCPNVVMEAMACGRAVVATDAGDIPFLVEDGKTGFVVRRGDDVSLADRLTELITDRDLCRRMGEAARLKAERDFGLDRLLDQTHAAYRSAGWRAS